MRLDLLAFCFFQFWHPFPVMAPKDQPLFSGSCAQPSQALGTKQFRPVEMNCGLAKTVWCVVMCLLWSRVLLLHGSTSLLLAFLRYLGLAQCCQHLLVRCWAWKILNANLAVLCGHAEAKSWSTASTMPGLKLLSF